MSQQENLLTIHQIIHWLDRERKSQGISDFCIALDRLAICSYYLASDLADAHEAMNNTEEAYKSAVAKFVAEFDGPAAKAERLAEVEHVGKKKEFIGNKNLYNKLKSFMDRIDAVLDSHKQYVSFLKQEHKHAAV